MSISKTIKSICAAMSILLIWGCAANQPFFSSSATMAEGPGATRIDPNSIDYEIFLVGDIGAKSELENPIDIVSVIKNQLDPDKDNQTVVFLGNSIGTESLPDEEDPEYKRISKILEDNIKEIRSKTDKLYFIPGNQEWNNGKNYTVEAVKEAENFIEGLAKGKNVFAPGGGCGEPKVVELTDDLVLILVDSQWLIQGDESNERKRSGCDIDDEIEFITLLKEELAEHKRRNVVIATHHPLYSNGRVGGNYPLTSHLLPVPILGSVITGIRKLAATEQRFGHPLYEAYRTAMFSAINNFDGVISVSGHEQNLQYQSDNGNHYIVAGSGQNVDFAQTGGDAEFVYMSQGFAKLTHTKSMQLWLEFFVPDENDKSKFKPIFRKLLHEKEKIDFDNQNIYKGSEEYPPTVTKQASELYEKSGNRVKRQYSEEWSTEVELPVMLLDEVDGGLKPVKQGGGFSTLSLRLENPEGRQYVLRTVDKDVSKVVPVALRNTFAKKLIQGGIAAAHPYSALVVPKLAEAAEIYHANPKYVWLPHQKALGEYDTDFAEKVYLFEERPGGKTKGHPTFGGTEKTVNSLELVENLFKNHKHKVDQQYVLRARLFDILIGDWDRHDDQWRWGTYKDPEHPKHTIYRAIPRDRDQVFYRNNGPGNFLASRTWLNPQLRIFDEKIDNLRGLVNNARYFDRHFLSQMTESDFVAQAEKLQKQITDDVIAAAFLDYPAKIHAIRGNEIIEKLKVRRSDLVEYAREFYRHISAEVTVPGTNGRNIFEVNAIPDNQLDVKVYHLDDDRDRHLIWSRVIDGNVTSEVRLFGLNKDDIFNISGTSPSTIKVRIVGGSGEDKVNNQSTELNVVVYDRPTGMTLSGNSVKSKIADKKGINSYDRKDWNLNRYFHFPMVTFYTDEGVGISYNLWWKNHGFRTDPYKSSHTLSAGFFFGNNAFIGKYTGHWPNAFGYNWDFKIDAFGAGPTFTQFFYGLGNEYINYGTVFPDVENSGRQQFHIVRGIELDFNPTIVHHLTKGRSISFKPYFGFVDLDETFKDNTRFIYQPEAGRSPDDYEANVFAGMGLHFESSRLNNHTMPTRGFDFTIGGDYKQNLTNSDFSHLTLSTNISAYIPFTPNQTVVLATNIGGAYTLGDYQFYHANYLSNRSRLRGFKTNRFAGDGIIYAATDLRIMLTEGSGAFPTGFGIFGSFDVGRAFLENQDIDQWHTSIGGGIFLIPLNILAFKVGYFAGEDDRQVLVGGSLAF